MVIPVDLALLRANPSFHPDACLDPTAEQGQRGSKTAPNSSTTSSETTYPYRVVTFRIVSPLPVTAVLLLVLSNSTVELSLS